MTQHPKLSKLDSDLLFNLLGFGFLALSGILINLTLAIFRGTEALGVFNQAFAIHLIVSQLSVGGLQFSTLKQISEEQDSPKQACSSLLSALILVTPISIIVCSLVFSYSEHLGNLLESTEVSKGINYLLLGLFFFPINKVLLMSVNGLRNMRAYALFNSGRYLLILVSLLILILNDFSNAELLMSLSITEVSLFIAYAVYLPVFLFRGNLALPTLGKILAHISFGARAIFSGLLIELNTRIDILMLGAFLTDSKVGIYSFAATIAEGFKQLPSILRWNLDPIFGNMMANNRTSGISGLVRETKRKYFPYFCFFCLTAILCYPFVLFLIGISSNFSDSWAVFGILLIAIAISTLYTPFSGILFQGGRPGTQSLITLATVSFNIIANILLIPVFGIYGAAIATAFTFILDALLIAYTTKRAFNIRL